MTEPTGPPEFTSHRAALSAALDQTPHLPRDLALIALARTIAERLDWLDDQVAEVGEEGVGLKGLLTLEGVRDKLTVRYIAVLDKMGMSPGSRTADGRGGESPGPPDPSAVALAHLQRGAEPGSAAVGVDYAASVDPAVTDALTDD